MPEPRTILVIQADPDVVRSVEKALEGDDYRLVLARDGLEGLGLVDRESPVLIIADLMLPRVDGATLLRALRSRESTRDVPVIFLTPNADAVTMLESMSLGIRYYLTTPILGDALRHHVRLAIQDHVDS